MEDGRRDVIWCAGNWLPGVSCRLRIRALGDGLGHVLHPSEVLVRKFQELGHAGIAWGGSLL